MDNVRKAYKKMITESKAYKKGATVWYTDNDGEDFEATIIAYDKKADDYMIDVSGRDVRVSPEEISLELEAKKNEAETANDTMYNWADINQAMMVIGFGPKVIIKLISALNKITK